jgi:hypothetical protein
MPKNIYTRVQESFRNEPANAADEQASPRNHSSDRSNLLVDVKSYTEQLYNAWKDGCAAVNRNAVATLAVMAIFELLAYQNNKQIFTIGSFTLTNTSIVQISLPVIVAFLTFNLYILSSRISEMENVYTSIMEQFASRVHANGLDLFVAPSLHSFWTPQNIVPRELATSYDKFREPITGALTLVTLILLPVAFEIQAFYHLFEKFGFQDPLLWISAGITGLLASCSIAFLFMGA